MGRPRGTEAEGRGAQTDDSSSAGSAATPLTSGDPSTGLLHSTRLLQRHNLHHGDGMDRTFPASFQCSCQKLKQKNCTPTITGVWPNPTIVLLGMDLPSSPRLDYRASHQRSSQFIYHHLSCHYTPLIAQSTVSNYPYSQPSLTLTALSEGYISLNIFVGSQVKFTQCVKNVLGNF